MRLIAKPVAVVDWEKLRDRWTHLTDLQPIRMCGGRIDILIGLEHATLITPIESHSMRDDEPTASKARLEWTLQGPAGNINDANAARSIEYLRRWMTECEC